MRKIYVVGNSLSYPGWMEGLITKKLENADLVVFTGGEDVDPSFYTDFKHPSTFSNVRRDLLEEEEFLEARKLGKKCIGICRGSQFLCVMNGGQLVQDQPNPKGRHLIKTYDGKEIEITSTHHQAAFPFNLDESDYKILGWTNELPYHEDGQRKELAPPKECEIVFYPKTDCLGIQGHPEMMRESHETITYLRNMLNEFMENKLVA